MNIPGCDIEEISDPEPVSITGTVISNELNPPSLNLKENDDDKGKKCLQNYDHMELQSRNHLENQKGKSPKEIQKATKKSGCCWCCKLCMLLLKCIGLFCYVFCCPPIPEMITRKLAFHPLKKGKTYLICGKDARGNLIRTDNAKKASQLTSLKLEVQNAAEGSSILIEDVVISTIKTTRGSYLPILRINCNSANKELNKDLVVLFSQPNSSDLGCYFQPNGLSFRDLTELLKADLYAYDYSGYGISNNRPSEKNIYADIEAAYKHVSESQGPHVRIVLLGYSIGTVPTIYMASKHPPNLCGIVLVAPLTSGIRLYIKTNKTYCLDRFLSYDRAPDVNVPALVCHGFVDNVIPKSHGEQLVQRFPRAVIPFFVEEANHLTIFSKQNLSVFLRIRSFLIHETDQLQAQAA